MEKIEIFESRAKHILWAVVFISIGLLFVILTLSDRRSLGYIFLGIGLGISFILLSLLFVYGAVRTKPILIVRDEGIWTRDYQKTVAWEDFLDVRLEDGMLILHLGKRSLTKNFPNSTAISRAFLGSSMFDLSLTNANKIQLAAALDKKFRR